MPFSSQKEPEPIAKDDAREVLTLKEAAEMLRCSPAHVSNLANGKVAGLPVLPHARPGRRVIFLRSELLEWLRSLKTKPEIQ